MQDTTPAVWAELGTPLIPETLSFLCDTTTSASTGCLIARLFMCHSTKRKILTASAIILTASTEVKLSVFVFIDFTGAVCDTFGESAANFWTADRFIER